MSEDRKKNTSLKNNKFEKKCPPHIQRRLDEIKKKSSEFWHSQKERQQKKSSR